MNSTADLIKVADAYKKAVAIDKDQTVSYRVFGDSKKLGDLRNGAAGITLKRFNRTMNWFRDNWPEGHELPAALAPQNTTGAA